jgi:hypothetical protein
LNVAWNARSASTRAYRTLTDEQFDEWGRFPDDVVLPATSCSRDASGEATS